MSRARLIEQTMPLSSSRRWNCPLARPRSERWSGASLLPRRQTDLRWPAGTWSRRWVVRMKVKSACRVRFGRSATKSRSRMPLAMIHRSPSSFGFPRRFGRTLSTSAVRSGSARRQARPRAHIAPGTTGAISAVDGLEVPVGRADELPAQSRGHWTDDGARHESPNARPPTPHRASSSRCLAGDARIAGKDRIWRYFAMQAAAFLRMSGSVRSRATSFFSAKSRPATLLCP